MFLIEPMRSDITLKVFRICFVGTATFDCFLDSTRLYTILMIAQGSMCAVCGTLAALVNEKGTLVDSVLLSRKLSSAKKSL